jgi:DNA mismatch repair protein MutL
MSFIQQLPTSVVNKIAAGEVIERPASVVKELVENALDAGANRIDVVVEKGGSQLMRVIDNGSGIVADELPLAVACHATSKIRDAEDLFRVNSLGFRGEALASIAAVSRMLIRSRKAEAESGAEIEVVGGSLKPVCPVGAAPGTMIEVQRLFFNTPVRKKFLRTPQTEMGHISEAFVRLALAYPRVHFTLANGNRKIRDLAPCGEMAERVVAIFGSEMTEHLIPIDSQEEGFRLHGIVANPMHSRGHNRMQYLFLNGRFIRDRSLQHALSEAYRGLLLSGRYPICFLTMEIEPSAVDVNVHPTKLEVRFQDAGRIYRQLLGTLRTKFLSSDLVARANLPAGQMQESSPSSCVEDETDEVRQSIPAASKVFEWARERGGQLNSVREGPAEPDENAPQRHQVLLDPGHTNPAFVPFGRSAAPCQDTPGRFSSSEDCGEPNDVVADQNDDSIGRESDSGKFPQRHGPNALQVHNRYLVTETEDGLEVIDQHALHERVLYEMLREKVESGAVEVQRLLVPEPVDLAANEAALVLDHLELFSCLGLEIKPFGGETVLVASYPAMLRSFSPEDVLRSLVERMVSSGHHLESRDLLDELLHSMACKAAVKYGDPLTPQEIEALLAQRHLARDHHHCPHGRPTTLVFTRQQLDRQFKRI